MAKIADILEIERQRSDPSQWNVIHLFKEGGFYRAYEWSAWLIVTISYSDEIRKESQDRKPLNVTHKTLRGSDDTFLFVGFPLKSADKFIPNRTSFETISDSQIDMAIELPEGINEVGYERDTALSPGVKNTDGQYCLHRFSQAGAFRAPLIL